MLDKPVRELTEEDLLSVGVSPKCIREGFVINSKGRSIHRDDQGLYILCDPKASKEYRYTCIEGCLSIRDVLGDSAGFIVEIPTTSGGAKRCDQENLCRYDLISPIALRALAEVYGYGAQNYGEHNWKSGLTASNLLNHAYEHIEKWKMGDTSEPHLAHACWNIFTLLDMSYRKPHLMDVLDVVPTICPNTVLSHHKGSPETI